MNYIICYSLNHRGFGFNLFNTVSASLNITTHFTIGPKWPIILLFYQGCFKSLTHTGLNINLGQEREIIEYHSTTSSTRQHWTGFMTAAYNYKLVCILRIFSHVWCTHQKMNAVYQMLYNRTICSAKMYSAFLCVFIQV